MMQQLIRFPAREYGKFRHRFVEVFEGAVAGLSPLSIPSGTVTFRLEVDTASGTLTDDVLIDDFIGFDRLPPWLAGWPVSCLRT